MMDGLEAVPDGESLLQALYFRVHGLDESAAGGADEVVVVSAGTGRLIAGHAVGGYELGGLTAAAEEFEGPVDRGQAYAGQPPAGRPVYLFRAQMAGAGDQHPQYGVAPGAPARGRAGAEIAFFKRFLRHIDNGYHYPINRRALSSKKRKSAGPARAAGRTGYGAGVNLYIIIEQRFGRTNGNRRDQMKKTILTSIIALALGTGALFATEGHKDGRKAAAAKSDCGDCPMHKKAAARKCANKTCPEAMEGVETSARNTDSGVEITMTAKGEEAIAKLQELTLVHYSGKDTMDKDCPARVEGAESRIENTPAGVIVHLTARTPAAIKKMQAASAREHRKAGCPEEHHKKEAKASKKYVCPMGCAESDKPGKCPKCGMNMTERK